jgi:hypothetical protein
MEYIFKDSVTSSVDTNVPPVHQRGSQLLSQITIFQRHLLSFRLCQRVKLYVYEAKQYCQLTKNWPG